MHLTVVGPDGGRDVEVTFGPGATLADLVAAAGLTAASPGAVPHLDGRPSAPEASPAHAGLAAGSTLSVGEQPPPPPDRAARLAILAGPGAGTAPELEAGCHRLGGIRLRVSPGGPIRVAVEGRPERRLDAGAVLTVGGTVLGALPPAEPVPPRRIVPGRRGTTPFNRPPRRLPAVAVTALRLPDPPPPPPAASTVGVAALAIPLLLAGAMALLYDPRFALFALLGPLLLAGTALEDRRRRRRHARTTAATQREAVAALRGGLERARHAEARRRRHRLPTVPDLRARAGGAPGLWERLPAHDDFMHLAAGYGCVPWQPPLAGDGEVPEAARPALAHGLIPAAPVPLALTAGQVLGVAGSRPDALALARGLVAQAVTLHGPAHLQVAVVTDHPGDWDWVKWVPHTRARSSSRHRLLAAGAADEATVTGLLLPLAAAPRSGTAAEPGGGVEEPLTLVVCDVDDLSRPEHTALRHVLGGRGVPVAAVVLAARREQLPSPCTAVAAVAGGTVHLDTVPVPLGIVGATEAAAAELARALARWDDPDRPDDGAELPGTVPLLDLLGMPVPRPETVAARWGSTDRPAAPIGVTDAGPLVIDLLADGPHGLLAGTTGSGKSELLRTLVASLAASVDPEHLVFVLIDYKGGSAFDACAGLPHTAGMVTDLDDSLAERALLCLEAELRHREARLRHAGVDDLRLLDLGPGDEPLPRMLIVIDEFAALARELPDFMDALVDVAARGRSLGVHLLLATQRPAGVVRDNVRANTNLRIALRVQDGGDSTDVIGDARAASVPRSRPGRGYLRLGPAEVGAFQAAIVTGIGGGEPAVTLRPFTFGAEPAAPAAAAAGPRGGPTDLERLVAAVGEAARRTGMRPVRRPWPDPLPDDLLLSDLDAEAPPTPGAVAVGLVDEPDEQRRGVRWWDPSAGSTILYGVAGAGTTTAMAAMALGLTASRPPDELHLYVLDCDAGELAPLALLPHAGAVVGLSERERQVRLLRMLGEEMEARSSAGVAGRPAVVLLVDGYHAFTAAHEGLLDAGTREALDRLVTDGAAVGITAVVSASRYNAVPAAVSGAVASKLLFRTADPTAATMLGVRSLPDPMPPGRAVDPSTGRHVQIARPHPDGIAAAVAAMAAPATPRRGGPAPVEELPAVVKVPEVAGWLHLGEEVWHLPVGIGDHRLAPVGWRLGEGDHVLVAGEGRSGRSTLLAALATMVAERAPEAAVLGIAPRRSPLREVPGLTDLVTDPAGVAAAVSALLDGSGPRLVLVDDADDLDDPDGSMAALAAQRRPDLHVVAAARRDVKGRYGHWARDLCRSRQGLWLKPSEGVDGDLWSTPLPRRIPAAMPPGRGYLLAEGTVEVVQVMGY